jgi:dTDP-4-dehydrorhamnose reductase
MAVDKILVTGSNGQLGNELRDLAHLFNQFEFIFLTREDLPITDKKIAGRIFEKHAPRYLINCAAYTAVDRAEQEKEIADNVNGLAAGELAALCNHHQCGFIHISTDYVFNGQATQPLKESDNTEPVNAYGASKLLGEELVQENNPVSIIIRTSWVYSAYGKNFVKTMLGLMNQKEQIGVVNDQTGSPTYAADLAEAIMQIICSGKWIPGIFHFSNDGIITWFDFAKEIKAIAGLACVVNPISTDKFPTPAKRPGYSVLNKSKIQEVYGLQLKDWKDSLRKCLEKLNAIAG